MARREFLRRTAAGAAGAALLALPEKLYASETDPSIDVTAGTTGAPTTGFDFEEITIAELREGLQTGRWDTRTVTERHLARILEIDRSGPRLNAMLEMNGEARTIAATLDAEQQSKGFRGPLHGVPVVLKDNIGTADTMHTSGGSLALAASIAPADAFVVRQLRAAGAVILGKANLSEWANSRGRSAVGGWSGRGHLTKNPYVLDRSPSGSSSGSAVAVAASLATAAIGTETLGSIMSPSSVCGVVGLKPTVGLVSRSGVIPLSITQDSVGPICRTVRDVAIMLGAMTGIDPADPATAASAGHAETDYTKFLDRRALEGARVGVARNLFGPTAAVDRVIDRALDVMADAGAVIVDSTNIGTASALWDYETELLAYELKHALNEYLRGLHPSVRVRSLEDLIKFNDANSDRELQWFGQESFHYAQSKGDLSEAEYLEARAQLRNLSRTLGIDATLGKHKLDVIVAPTQGPAWIADMLCGDNSAHTAFVPSAVAGYPTLTVPAGDVAGLPVGMLLMGPAWSEGKLLALGFAFEAAMNARRAPQYLQSLPLHP